VGNMKFAYWNDTSNITQKCTHYLQIKLLRWNNIEVCSPAIIPVLNCKLFGIFNIVNTFYFVSDTYTNCYFNVYVTLVTLGRFLRGKSSKCMGHGGDL